MRELSPVLHTNRDYRFYLHEDTYIVWLAGVNRYIRFREPAYHVFQQWAAGEKPGRIAAECVRRYALSKARSNRFVREITSQLEDLFRDHRPPESQEISEELKDYTPEIHSTKNYKVGDKEFSVDYGDEALADLFHPLFSFYENREANTASPFHLEVFFKDELAVIRVNKTGITVFSAQNPEAYQGEFNIRLISYIHNLPPENWMGVLHASAVTDGSSALLFTASSGSGKSSIATLMMVNGFGFLSDDFVPIAMTAPEICRFPTAISVKSNAFPYMKRYIPALEEYSQEQDPEGEIYEVFVPAAGENPADMKVPAKGIVFVNWDPSVGFSMVLESNLGMMNDFIRQAWIANHPDAASRFMEWYFSLPVYSLRYSDNEKAVDGLAKLFSHG